MTDNSLAVAHYNVFFFQAQLYVKFRTESAVRATHKASGISVRVESERSQHANKKLALTLLAQKLAEHHAGQADDYARAQHSQLYQVERGNPKRMFVGTEFKEKSDSKR